MNQTLPKQVIKPNARFDCNILRCFTHAIKNQINRRDMIYQLFRKELIAVYRKSFFGSAWVIITPLTGMVSWAFLHYAQVIQPGDVGVPYPAYVLIGTLIWGLFIRISNTFMNALQKYRALIHSVNFPHEIIYGTTLLFILTEFFISFVIAVALLLFFKIKITWTIILFPLILPPLLFFAMSIGLLASVLSVVSYDMKQVVVPFLRLLMYTVPIIYSSDVVTNPYIKMIIQYNPLTYLVCSARDIVLTGKLYSFQGFLISSVLSGFILIFAWRIFYVTEDKLLERIM